MDRWVDRVALVTGASAGIGEAVARRLVQHGMKVVGCGRNIDKIQELADSLKKEKGSLLAVRCDLRQEEDILSLFDQIKQQYGGVDVCVNNAGLAHYAPLLSGETNQWKEVVDVNILALCICTREAIKSMRERDVDDGHIIQVNGLAGHRTLNSPALHFHSATKFAVKALIEGVRNELRAIKSNIRISSISPGLVKTEFLNKMFAGNENLRPALFDGQSLSPDDIADGILYTLAAPGHVQVHDILLRPVQQIA